MSFASRIKGKEMACIVRILEIFGVVEQRQMRELFSRLSDEAYGKILSHLNSDGLVYWAKDGVRLAASRLTLERTDFDASVMCFWAFVKMKDKIEDFCSGDPPALITVTTGANTVDLIPKTPMRSTGTWKRCRKRQRGSWSLGILSSFPASRGDTRTIMSCMWIRAGTLRLMNCEEL